MPKTTKLTLEIELSEQDMQDLLTCSIERVMNTAIEVGSAGKRAKNAHIAELSSSLEQDCIELKQLNTKMWNTIRNAVFIYKQTA